MLELEKKSLNPFANISLKYTENHNNGDTSLKVEKESLRNKTLIASLSLDPGTRCTLFHHTA